MNSVNATTVNDESSSNKKESSSYAPVVTIEEEAPHPNKDLLLSDRYMDNAITGLHHHKKDDAANLDNTILHLTDRSDRSTMDEQEQESSFKISHHMSRVAKQEILRIKFAKRTRVVECEHRLDQFIKKYYRQISLEKSFNTEGFKIHA